MTPNRYPGINPHLNSALQQNHWKSFHTAHLAHLAESIEILLPPNYYTILEDSLQMSLESDAGKYAVADIMIRQHEPTVAPGTAITEMIPTAPTLTLDVFDDDAFVPSIMIYQNNRPITRIELLSPANKWLGTHHDPYMKKRKATLVNKVRLVEIDYLHESPPLSLRLPAYCDGESGAYPYMIIVSDPTKTIDGMDVYGFGVLDTIPIIPIPLEDTDKVIVDFGAVYQRTFNSSRFFSDILTDYRQPPIKLSRYTPDDRAQILQHMAKIAEKPA